MPEPIENQTTRASKKWVPKGRSPIEEEQNEDEEEEETQNEETQLNAISQRRNSSLRDLGSTWIFSSTSDCQHLTTQVSRRTRVSEARDDSC